MRAGPSTSGRWRIVAGPSGQVPTRRRIRRLRRRPERDISRRCARVLQLGGRLGWPIGEDRVDLLTGAGDDAAQAADLLRVVEGATARAVEDSLRHGTQLI